MSLPASVASSGLAPCELRRSCDAQRLPFATTAELADFETALGQQRALDAIEFGTGIRREGYNLFAMGPEGAGRHTLVRRHLEKHAAGLQPPDDWCYVFNFDTPHKPCALRFPPGHALAFKTSMERLVEDLRSAIPAAFETDEYRNRRREIETQLGERQERALNEIGERARAQGVALIRTPSGFGFGPMGKDTVMSPEDYRQLPPEEQKRFEELIPRLQEELTLLL